MVAPTVFVQWWGRASTPGSPLLRARDNAQDRTPHDFAGSRVKGGRMQVILSGPFGRWVLQSTDDWPPNRNHRGNDFMQSTRCQQKSVGRVLPWLVAGWLTVVTASSSRYPPLPPLSFFLSPWRYFFGGAWLTSHC